MNKLKFFFAGLVFVGLPLTASAGEFSAPQAKETMEILRKHKLSSGAPFGHWDVELTDVFCSIENGADGNVEFVCSMFDPSQPATISGKDAGRLFAIFAVNGSKADSSVPGRLTISFESLSCLYSGSYRCELK